MAVFEHRSAEKEDDPTIVERIEVRPWSLGGKSHQEFLIGSGVNFDATTGILIEIIYSVNDVQLFYTRNFIHHVEYQFPISEKGDSLEKFKTGERNGYGFGDMLPETSIFLQREIHTSGDGEDKQVTYTSYCLEISADIGAGICTSGPGQRWINIKLDLDDADDGIEFMRQLTAEIAELYQGKNPDPANVPTDSSNWSFARISNQRAYDKLSEDYNEKYFSEQLLTEKFDDWLNGIPAGGHILDVGCGHGKPVIARILEKGYHVTGSDLSPKMLERAREHFPGVPFLNQMASELTCEAEFDGACSLSSMLYLDPIDLSHGLYRLHHALKPNGLLFLYAYDLHPGWRGAPYQVEMGQRMWTWTYGMDEVVQRLEEHGYFKVLKAENVTSEEEKQALIEKWYEDAKAQYDSFMERYPTSQYPMPDINKPPRLAYKYAIIARR
jgi:SAM-dependent methyltransferase